MPEFKFRSLIKKDWSKIEESGNEGYYTSASLLDSGIEGCRWHRVVLDANIPDNSTITLYFYASPRSDKGCSCLSESMECECPQQKIVFNKYARDALLNLVGRYLEVSVHYHFEGDERPDLKLAKVYYPRQSYLRYLPAVYQEDERSREFLERYLSIFESNLYDSDELISGISSYFDPRSAPDEFIPWLASWVSLDLYDLLKEKNRDFILNAVKLYQLKGTARGLRLLAETLTGKRCCVREFGKNIFRTYAYGMENYEEEDAVDGSGCIKSARRISRTVDTTKVKPSKIGTREDTLHYTVGKSANGLYYPNAVELYIRLVGSEGLDIQPEELQRIIESFLPVFVTLKISIVKEEPERELYTLESIYEDRRDLFHVLTRSTEAQHIVRGSYIDGADWDMMYTFKDGIKPWKLTNHKGYRTMHRNIGRYISI
jgi:phage tail-like protein